jgi:hypothetical protein
MFNARELANPNPNPLISFDSGTSQPLSAIEKRPCFYWGFYPIWLTGIAS